MAPSQDRISTLPRRSELAIERIGNASGLEISRWDNGAIFAMEHVRGDARTMINQTLGSPVVRGMTEIVLRMGGNAPRNIPLLAPATGGELGVSTHGLHWRGRQDGLEHVVNLWLHPSEDRWIWRVHIRNNGPDPLACDAVLIADIGLGEPNFVMGNEAYASQYLDHHIATHPEFGPVLMNRQNLRQNGGFPWVAHACAEGAAGFATDLRQVLEPVHRDADGLSLPFGTSLPSQKLQFESACAALQSKPVTLPPGGSVRWTFTGCFLADHPAASGEADVALISAPQPETAWMEPAQSWRPALVSLVQAAPALRASAFSADELNRLYPARTHEEHDNEGRLLSFFVPDEVCASHVVLAQKERMVARRHGLLMRSGADMLPSARTFSITTWMHGIFGAQISLGNTSFHQLFSISRDPYNITRGSGLRILADQGAGWQLLTIPTAFDMAPDACRWLYRTPSALITVQAVVSGLDAAVQWRIEVEGAPCRFLIFGHVVMGEREYASAGRVTFAPGQRRIGFQFAADDLWGKAYPDAAFHLTCATPDTLDTLGGDELLYADGHLRNGPRVALRTKATHVFVFSVTGSLTDADTAETLASRYEHPVDTADLRRSSADWWRNLTRGIRISGPPDSSAEAMDTLLPWMVHNAMVHLTIPHGLEQYTGAAWGTRDVCQGPVELLLSLEHDAHVKDILRILFAQQYEHSGDWPQWFMLEPYSFIQDKHAHGDVIIWPLKALCDYLETTGDFAFLDEQIPWRREDTFAKTSHTASIYEHISKLIATLRGQCLTGTALVRYGNGDWNDSLQPVNPAQRDLMVSSWTVALLYQQLNRYAALLHRQGQTASADDLSKFAREMRADVNRHLIRDGIIAGYGLFSPQGKIETLLLHPDDTITGVSYSLLPMIQGITGGLFTPEQAESHAALIEKYLVFADGARLMDKPIAYHGGLETLFRRAESAAFFGREIGLMYVHSHLRYCEAMADMGRAEILWSGLLTVNPIAVTERLAHASLRQRNTYFSSSDAAFPDRLAASAEWDRIRNQTIAADGGWRIYSSGPGLYINMLVQHAFGLRRRYGQRLEKPCLPEAFAGLRLIWPGRGKD